MSSNLLERVKWAIRAGMTFGGKRNLYEVFGYKTTLTFDDFLARYLRQDIATRIIDAPVQATWRRQPVVQDDKGVDGEFSKAWNKFAKKQKVYFYLERLDRLAGIGQYAVLMFGVPGKLDAAPGKSKDLNYLQPYNESHARILQLGDDPTSADFAMPKEYEITVPKSTIAGTALQQARAGKTHKVHAGRILHVAETLLEDSLYGVSRLGNIYNRLDDLEKVVGGSAETYWLTSNRGMQADVDPEMTLDEEDETNLSEEIEEYQHELRRYIRTRGVKITELGSDVADPEGNFKVQVAIIAGAKGIPQRILIGSERGELASEQDRSNWANRIEERQKFYAEPMVLSPFVEMSVNLGLIPEPSGDIEIIWPDSFAPSPLERAQTMAQKARAATNLAKALDSENSPITQGEAREFLGLNPEMEGGSTDMGDVTDVPEDELNTPDEDGDGKQTPMAS